MCRFETDSRTLVLFVRHMVKGNAFKPTKIMTEWKIYCIFCVSQRDKLNYENNVMNMKIFAVCHTNIAERQINRWISAINNS